MGVPALFRWLTTKYPMLTSRVHEERSMEMEDGTVIPVDLTKSNPNGTEFDNLYLDMNGIIHPCTHPEHKAAPATEAEAMLAIFEYIDRIMSMVRPRKVLYMAIDGVAPRAKMNQQRSRRFRAAQEAELKREEEEKLRLELSVSENDKHKEDAFDSNCITPGTPFMHRLATSLRYFVARKMNTEEGWRDLKVILSDSNSPGEGEHKIMEYIRHQRVLKHYDPNTKHVLYGLDADLIMLGLATHEPHFKVLREDVFAQELGGVRCYTCNQTGHMASQCTGVIKTSNSATDAKEYSMKPFVFLHVNVLREYLNYEMHVPGLPFRFDVERAIDDWVFMCFFVGNDFLPHLPSLELREGAIDTLIDIYKKCLPTMGGYLTSNGDVCLERVQLILHELGKLENGIFERRRNNELRRIENSGRRQKEHNKKNGSSWNNVKLKEYAVEVANIHETLKVSKEFVQDRVEIRNANLTAAQALKQKLLEEQQTKTTGDKRSRDKEKQDQTETKKLKLSSDKPENDEVKNLSDAATDSSSNDEVLDESKHPLAQVTEADDENVLDDVRLWESGWRVRYYKTKFDVDHANDSFRKEMMHSYITGLCWVLKYYYQGCPSWKWYYPYHYAPFASDIEVLSFGPNDHISFPKDSPSTPFEQLMAVLPAASKSHIPRVYWPLMTDDDSPIIDFYPESFKIDLNGKKYAWQGVALLPFIDERRLLDAMSSVADGLSENEKERNTLGSDILFVGNSHHAFDYLCNILNDMPSSTKKTLDPKLTDGLNGIVSLKPYSYMPGSTLPSPLISVGLENLAYNHSVCLSFSNPPSPKAGFVFPSLLLKDTILPERFLTHDDLLMMGKKERRNYNNSSRGRSNYDNRYNRDYREDTQLQRRRPDFSEAAYPSEAHATPYNSYHQQYYGYQYPAHYNQAAEAQYQNPYYYPQWQQPRASNEHAGSFDNDQSRQHAPSDPARVSGYDAFASQSNSTGRPQNYAWNRNLRNNRQ